MEPGQEPFSSKKYMHPRLVCNIVRTEKNLASPILNFRNTLATHHATFVRVLKTILFLFFESLSKNKTHLFFYSSRHKRVSHIFV
jgi:hypothetical protein